MVYVTRGLVDALLELAAEAEPNAVNVVLGATRAETLEPDPELEPDTRILTHFYFPETGRSVRSVFGMDLGTPTGGASARFLTHPQGRLELTERDDLAAIVLLAVPPWEESTLAAFTRSGERLDLKVLDAEPPRESLA